MEIETASADDLNNSDAWMAEVNLSAVAEEFERNMSGIHSADLAKTDGEYKTKSVSDSCMSVQEIHLQERFNFNLKKDVLIDTKSVRTSTLSKNSSAVSASKTLRTSSPLNVSSEMLCNKDNLLDLSSQDDLFEDSALGQTDLSTDGQSDYIQTPLGKKCDHLVFANHMGASEDFINTANQQTQCNFSDSGCPSSAVLDSTRPAVTHNAFIQSGPVTSLKNRMKERLLTNATAEKPLQNTLQELRNESISRAQLEASQIRREISSQDVGPFFGLPNKVQELLATNRKIMKLYEWQEHCLQLPAVYRGGNLIYTLPTSGGKTLVAEILILRQLLCRKKDAIMILPYVSIVQEKVRILSEFATELGFLVEEYAGSKGRFPPTKRQVKHSLYITTIEKGQSLVNCLLEAERSNEIGLVVVDELHMIGEGGSRGAAMESTLLKLLYGTNVCCLCHLEPPQIIGMSATLNNIADLCKFLKAEVFCSDFRPVALTEYVKVEVNLFKVDNTALVPDDRLQHDRFLTFTFAICLLCHVILKQTLDAKKVDPDQLLDLVLEIIPDKSCLLFCPTKKNCENVVQMLATLIRKHHQKHADINKEQRRALLQELKMDGGGKVCPTLCRTIPYGLAYHHSGLTTDERRVIENAYSDGILCLLTCTSTLAAGVNLPAKRVILRSPFVGADFMKHSQYKQMTGRAGRAGIDSSGESILIAKNSDMPKLLEMLSGPQDICHSSLMCDNGKGLRCLILSLIGLKIVNTIESILMVISQSLLAIQASTLGVDVTLATQNALQNLLDEGLVIQKNVSQCMRSQGKKGTEHQTKTPALNPTNVLGDIPPEDISQSSMRKSQNSTSCLLKEIICFQNSPEERKTAGEPIGDDQSERAQAKRQRMSESQDAVLEPGLDIAGSGFLGIQTTKHSQSNQVCHEDGHLTKMKDPCAEKKINIVAEQTRLSDLVIEVTGLGKATFKGSVDLQCGGRLYQDLKHGEQSLVLVNYLHLMFLVTPYEMARDVSPHWMIYLDQYSRLSPDEIKVANLIGVPESYLIKKATAQACRQKVDALTIQRFFLTLMLYDLWRQVSIWDVAERYQQPRGFVQNLLSSTASFASCVLRFCQELPEFWPYQELLGNFVRNLAYCVSMELIPLMEVPGIKLGRAKQLYSAGYQTQQALASADPRELVARVKFLTHKAARQLVSAAKVLLEEKAEALLEKVQELVPLPLLNLESTSMGISNAYPVTALENEDTRVPQTR